ncbi:YciI family protein [Herbiconiux daphne]|uniref:YciI family protein n=1 Tax=Herbiconiux daphne TaxID=2970914 RepID=A0ABT2H3X7_9MICO|nr:YciI family protein [Herbiconiux daphne]MCS5734642.1 YciI family protein [Herbiconiux daphne]
MRYSLLLTNQEAQDAGVTEEDMAPFRAAFDAYAKSLEQAGVLISADILQPSAATTTITLRNGTLEVQDGPFADTKEKLAGAFVVDVPDLDAAIAWAEKCPGAQYGVIEIRPTALSFSDGQWHELG